MSNLRPLSKELQQKAIDEINEDVSRIPQDIQAIKDWFKQQKHIIAQIDDQLILTFLRGCKFSLERTKAKIDAYYTLRTLLPEFFENRDPFKPELQEILKRGTFLPLINQTNPTAPRLFLQNLNYDPNISKKEDIIKLQAMIIEIIMREDDQATICGMQGLVEMANVKMSQVFPPLLIMKTLKCMEDVSPARVKGVHILNMSPIFESIINFIKSFLSEKLNGRVFLHTMRHHEELHKKIHRKDLPKDYGGDGPSIQELKDYWKKKVESYAEWFKENEKCGTDEKLRLGKPKTTEDVFGIAGSFRKLNVD